MWRELFGLERKAQSLVDLIVPRRSFNDVILPPETRQQLYEALTQIDKHRLIFNQWGLGERHPNGTGLIFNFAGPPGTGKTICAEALAFTLGRKLLRVNYAELESCWMGETGKNIRQIFREARAADAVLFFDEADTIASARFAHTTAANEREANLTINILLKEVEEHDGVVVFATNMASNFDPAFERRIRTHILFRTPNAEEREQIWRVQVHPEKTPLADDVDFHDLAERYSLTGGKIQVAVLKAAQMAAAEEGADDRKQIHRRHFEAAITQVEAAREVMQQNVNEEPEAALRSAAEALEGRFKQVDEDVHACRTELGLLADTQGELRATLEERTAELVARAEVIGDEGRATREEVRALRGELEGVASALDEIRGDLQRQAEASRTALDRWHGEQGELVKQLTARIETQESRLSRATLIPWPKETTTVAAAVLALVLLLAGGAAGHFLIR
jgi:MoxR-like ATPase